MISYEQPRGAVHDLEHLESLSSDRCNILFVSDRVLYLLHNFAALDCTFPARYALELEQNGYVPVSREQSSEWDLYESLVTAFQLEVLSMTCDIENGLLAIADAIRVSGGGGCTSVGIPLFDCLADLSNDQLLPPPGSDVGEPFVDPPPAGFATWGEYLAYKCQAAEFIWDLERKHMVALRNFDAVALVASIGAPIIAGLLGVLPAAMTPPGFAVFVGSVVAIGVVAGASWFYMDEMIDEWDANHDAIVCALYGSGTSTAAVTALANALEDAIQAIVSWGALAPVSGEIAGLLSGAFSQLAGNGIVAPLFEAVVSATQYDADCSGCGGFGECADGPRFDPWCGPGQDEDCGSGLLTQGSGRVWTSYPHPTDSTHRIDARLDANRDIDFVSKSGFVSGWGDNSVRRWACVEGGMNLIDNAATPEELPWPECFGLVVFISSTPFTITVDIGATC